MRKVLFLWSKDNTSPTAFLKRVRETQTKEMKRIFRINFRSGFGTKF